MVFLIYVYIHRRSPILAADVIFPGGSYEARIQEGGNLEKATLDTFIKRLDKGVYLLKIDIQGEEFNALKGAVGSFPRIRNMIVATHGKETHNYCLNILIAEGYKVLFEQAEVENQFDGIIAVSKYKFL